MFILIALIGLSKVVTNSGLLYNGGNTFVIIVL